VIIISGDDEYLHGNTRITLPNLRIPWIP